MTKAVSPEPRAGNRAPRVAEFAGGMLNSVGLANPGLEAVCQEHLPWLAREHPTLPVIVNVVGNTVDDYRRVVARVSSLPGVAALELNLSCPNSSAGGLEFGADPASVTAVVRSCRAAAALPILAKLSPALPDIRLDGSGGGPGRRGWRHPGEYHSRFSLRRGNRVAPARQRQWGSQRARPPGRGHSGHTPGSGAASGYGDHRGRRRALGRGSPAVPGGGGQSRGHRHCRPGATRAFPAASSGSWSCPVAEVIVALDLPTARDALRLLDRIPGARWVKVGSVLMTREGPALLRDLADRGLKVFLDLKWHDIPNTVVGAVEAARSQGVVMATVHTLGGEAMMRAAGEAAGRDLGLVGVTVLTSHSPEEYATAVGRGAVDLEARGRTPGWPGDGLGPPGHRLLGARGRPRAEQGRSGGLDRGAGNSSARRFDRRPGENSGSGPGGQGGGESSRGRAPHPPGLRPGCRPPGHCGGCRLMFGIAAVCPGHSAWSFLQGDRIWKRPPGRLAPRCSAMTLRRSSGRAPDFWSSSPAWLHQARFPAARRSRSWRHICMIMKRLRCRSSRLRRPLRRRESSS